MTFSMHVRRRGNNSEETDFNFRFPENFSKQQFVKSDVRNVSKYLGRDLHVSSECRWAEEAAFGMHKVQVQG